MKRRKTVCNISARCCRMEFKARSIGSIGALVWWQFTVVDATQRKNSCMNLYQPLSSAGSELNSPSSLPPAFKQRICRFRTMVSPNYVQRLYDEWYAFLCTTLVDELLVCKFRSKGAGLPTKKTNFGKQGAIRSA